MYSDFIIVKQSQFIIFVLFVFFFLSGSEISNVQLIFSLSIESDSKNSFSRSRCVDSRQQLATTNKIQGFYRFLIRCYSIFYRNLLAGYASETTRRLCRRVVSKERRRGDSLVLGKKRSLNRPFITLHVRKTNR